MLDNIKYITLPENGKAGQTSDGRWYCKDVPFKDAKDLRIKIGEINKVLNDYNQKVKNDKKK